MECLTYFRSWSGNDNAYSTIRRSMEMDPRLKVTLPNKVFLLNFHLQSVWLDGYINFSIFAHL